MCNENSAETQEDIDAFLDQELSQLTLLPSLPAPEALTPKLSLKAMFDAKRAADRTKAEALNERAKAARRDRKSAATAEGLKDRKARNKREQRAREKLAREQLPEATAAALSGLDILPVAVDPAVLAREAAGLAAWLATTGRSQGALRSVELKRPGDLMASRAVYLGLVAEIGVIPSWQIFADRLSAATRRPWSREQARRRYEKFETLEGPSGPWKAR